MFDLIAQNKMIQMMDRSLTLASRRMSLIASNLANIDTPQYRTQDFSFRDAFNQEMTSLDRQFSPTSGSLPSHFQARSEVASPEISDPIDLKYERNDGNDVSLDRETMNLASTQATYQIAAQIAQAELKRLSGAIQSAAK
jgi:flagellar basal-body rod protein FlgB